jgi:hypothetical protein
VRYTGFALQAPSYKIESETEGPVIVFELWLRKLGYTPVREKPRYRVPMGRD